MRLDKINPRTYYLMGELYSRTDTHLGFFWLDEESNTFEFQSVPGWRVRIEEMEYLVELFEQINNAR